MANSKPRYRSCAAFSKETVAKLTALYDVGMVTSGRDCSDLHQAAAIATGLSVEQVKVTHYHVALSTR